MTGVKEHIYYNNKSGKGKTVCSSHVLAYLGVPPDAYHYSSSIGNISGTLRRFGYAVRSRDSSCKVSSRNGAMPTMGVVRGAIKKLNDPDATHYAVYVSGHVLLLDRNGKTVVDTDPRKVDRRKVWAVRAVFKKPNE